MQSLSTPLAAEKITIKLSRAHLRHIAITTSIAFIITIMGFERLSINIGPARVRMAYIVVAITLSIVLLHRLMTLERKSALLIGGFIVFAIPSLALSRNISRSVLYMGWVAINYLAVYELFSTFARRWPTSTYKAVLYSFRFQIIVAWLMVMAGININQTALLGNLESAYSLEFLETFNTGRAYLLYQEPSFFVFALSLYVGIVTFSLVNKGILANWTDIAIVLVAVISTSSATLLVIILLAFIIAAIAKITLKKILLGGMGAGLIFIAGYSIAHSQPNTVEAQYIGARSLSNDTLIVDTLQGVFASDDPIKYLKFRSGGRFMLMDCQWRIFTQFPLSGVGIGAYSEYTEKAGFIRCLDETDYPLGAGALLYGLRALPVMNIYVELLATVGLLASSFFFLFVLRHIFRKQLSGLSPVQMGYWVGMMVLLIAAVAQPTYLNPFLWMTMGIYAGSTKRANRKPE